MGENKIRLSLEKPVSIREKVYAVVREDNPRGPVGVLGGPDRQLGPAGHLTPEQMREIQLETDRRWAGLKEKAAQEQ